jgi:hypothetical protein
LVLNVYASTLLELLVLSSQLTVDMGTFLEPTGATGQSGNNGTTLDLGGIEKLNAVTTGIKAVLDSRQWQTAWHTYWNEKKMIMCARICGKSKTISTPGDQFLERDHF